MLPRKNWKDGEVILPLGILLILTTSITMSAAMPGTSPIVMSAGSVWFGAFVSYAPLAYIVNRFLHRHETTWPEGFGYKIRTKFPLGAWVLLSVILCVGGAMLLQSLFALLAKSPDNVSTLQSSVVTLAQGTIAAKAAVLWSALVFAPFIEECLFRGILYPWLRDRGLDRMAMIGTSVLFGLMHGNLRAFLPLTFFGIYQCFLYRRTGNLLACIFTHVGFNAVFVAITLSGVALE